MNKKLYNIVYSRNNKLNKIIGENNNLKSLNTQLKMENKDLNCKFKNLKKKYQILNKYHNKSSNKGLINEITSLKSENEKYLNELTSLKSENEKYLNELTSLKKTNRNRYNTLEFINFQEYLARSYISPIVEAPFIQEDKRVFAFMDHLGKYLRNNLLISDYKPLISVIMPTYNRKNIVLKAITSVLNQSYTNFELIIIDDGSNDGSDTLLKSLKDPRIRVYFNNTNKGCSYSRNIGLKNAEGDIIMYLDSDNEWDSKYIETMVGAFIELPNADALYSGQYLYKNFDSKPYAVRFASYNKPLLHNHNFIDLNSFCHKSHILSKIKGFDENLVRLIDWDFILKISNIYTIYSVPVILTKYYNHDFENRISKMHVNYLEISEKILDRNKIPTKNYPPLNKKVSIIIPNYESLNELKICINSILACESKDMLDIIIVDNNSKKDVNNYLSNLKSEGKIKLILNNINYGFSFAINQGIDISDEDSDILLLNNDTILTRGSIEHMQYCAYSIPHCGLIVPHEMLFKGTNTISEHVPYAYNDFECDVTPSKAHHNIINMPVFHDGKLLELNFAPFFCTYIKREVYNKTLGLDSELGRHYRSDRIFSDFVRHILRLKIYQSPNSFVYHRHKVATHKLKENRKDEYRKIYDKNQWEDDLAKELGFKSAIWDF